MNLFDTHAHLMDSAYDEDKEEALKEAAELKLVINIGCDVPSSKEALALAERFPNFYAAVGIHPEEALKYSNEALNEIAELAKHPKNKAIGEVGLDYHWDVPKDVQKVAFEKQIALAKELKLPLIIHSREAHRDTLDILKACGAEEVGGVFHAYSGSVEMLDEVLAMNFYIGLGGVVTFKNAKKAVEVAKAVPMDRLLIETDCPYMTPVPYRGKRNHPKYVYYAAEKLAEIREVDVEEIIDQTYENGKRLFKID